MAAYKVFDLTPSTREASSERKTIVQGYEVRWPVLVAGLGGLAVGLVGCLMFYTVLGQFTVLVPMVTMVLSLWLFVGRSQRGMRQYNWQLLLDRRNRKTGQFMQAGQPIEPIDQGIRMIRTTAVTVPKKAKRALAVDDLVA